MALPASAPDGASRPIFNPLLPWIEIGTRALDISVASTQAVSDGIDRAARANAATAAASALDERAEQHAEEPGAATAAPRPKRPPAGKRKLSARV